VSIFLYIQKSAFPEMPHVYLGSFMGYLRDGEIVEEEAPNV
jgi:hypothetical protein